MLFNQWITRTYFLILFKMLFMYHNYDMPSRDITCIILYTLYTAYIYLYTLLLIYSYITNFLYICRYIFCISISYIYPKHIKLILLFVNKYLFCLSLRLGFVLSLVPLLTNHCLMSISRLFYLWLESHSPSKTVVIQCVFV